MKFDFLWKRKILGFTEFYLFFHSKYDQCLSIVEYFSGISDRILENNLLKCDFGHILTQKSRGRSVYRIIYFMENQKQTLKTSNIK